MPAMARCIVCGENIEGVEAGDALAREQGVLAAASGSCSRRQTRTSEPAHHLHGPGAVVAALGREGEAGGVEHDALAGGGVGGVGGVQARRGAPLARGADLAVPARRAGRR